MNRYIIITGGELFNKGAQAMTFITVNEIHTRWPDKKIVLLSTGDAQRDQEFLSNLTFEVIPSLRLRDVIALREKVILKKWMAKRDAGFQKLCHYFENADALFDISGYALGSNWGNDVAVSYIMRIIAAKGYKIPVFLLPQSFGPFDFSGWKKGAMNSMIRHYLKYCKIIMAREEEGSTLLQNKYGLKNVAKTNDIVLETPNIVLDKVFKTIPPEKHIQIDDNSIAVIPNMKTLKYMRKEEILPLYQSIIERVLPHGLKVYLIYHAVEDLKICRSIKEDFAGNDHVVLIEDELDCFEFSRIVGKFHFAVASRYHSIVNAYRNGVSAIVIGWATKYEELLETYHQEEFQIDVRNGVDEKKLMNALDAMINGYQESNARIRQITSKIQQTNVFDLIRLN